MVSTFPNGHVKSKQRKIVQLWQRTHWLPKRKTKPVTDGAAKMSEVKILRRALTTTPPTTPTTQSRKWCVNLTVQKLGNGMKISLYQTLLRLKMNRVCILSHASSECINHPTSTHLYTSRIGRQGRAGGGSGPSSRRLAGCPADTAGRAGDPS